MKRNLRQNIILIFLLSLTFSNSNIDVQDISLNTGARYVSAASGLRMYVNIWGHVANPGRILVEDGIDLATLLSLTGGPNKGANLKNVRVYHEYPDENGNVVNIVDFTDFLKMGDRSNFIKIQPNDTFIIKQTKWSYFIEEIGTANTLMNLINIYLNLKFII